MTWMKAADMRSLPRAARHERRVQVIRLRESGLTYEAIAEQVGLSRTGVFDICKRHKHGGEPALYDAPSGRRLGQGRALQGWHEWFVRKLIEDKTPDQLDLPQALWSRAAVGELIEQELGIHLSVRGVGGYLKRWGFTPQKPLRKAYEQSPEAVHKWLEQDYPAIAARARREGAEIHWGDESGLRSDDVRGRGYAPAGHTPQVRVNHRRHALSYISTVTNEGRMRWMIFDGALDAKLLIDFMERLVRDVDRKIYLILDNLRVHHARPVKAWLAEHREAIDVHYLPSYSPELNPNELLNAEVKRVVTRQAPARTKQQLLQAASRHLRSVQRRPERIRRFFRHAPVQYAA